MFEKEIKKTLRDMGVAPNLQGYAYLTEAIEHVIVDHNSLNLITKVLYPDVAKTFNTTPSRVERSIRHAIEQSFNIVPLDAVEKIFGNTINPLTGKPTNSHYIAALAEYVTDNYSAATAVGGACNDGNGLN